MQAAALLTRTKVACNRSGSLLAPRKHADRQRKLQARCGVISPRFDVSLGDIEQLAATFALSVRVHVGLELGAGLRVQIRAGLDE